MLYTDALFLLFLGLLCLVTYLLRPWPVLKEWVLIAFSLFVIASWGFFDLGLFLTVLFVNYFAAVFMIRVSGDRGRLVLTSIISLDLAVLLVFKYADFMGHNFGRLTGMHIPGFPLGIPLAISFYTFHLISYLVDLQARRIKMATMREYLFYLSFFPHVIAGPIVRAWQLIPQIGKTRRVRADFFMGFHFLVTGFFLKMVLANNIGFATDVFWNAPSTLSTLDSWLAVFCYYCQIYGDFAGYSLMALGMSRLLGYRLPVNFRSPMRACSMQEFWQRWHITLSKWLRDYVYIPLGGNRGSRLFSTRNVFITMFLGGLWHGAGWGFVIWGGMQGVGIVLERFLGWKVGKSQRLTFSLLAGWIVTQLWVSIAWVFFRIHGMHVTSLFLWHMLPLNFHHFLPQKSLVHVLVFAIPVFAHNFAPVFFRWIGRRYLPLALGVSTGILLLLNIIVYSPTAVFIYFRF